MFCCVWVTHSNITCITTNWVGWSKWRMYLIFCPIPSSYSSLRVRCLISYLTRYLFSSMPLLFLDTFPSMPPSFILLAMDSCPRLMSKMPIISKSEERGYFLLNIWLMSLGRCPFHGWLCSFCECRSSSPPCNKPLACLLGLHQQQIKQNVLG